MPFSLVRLLRRWLAALLLCSVAQAQDAGFSLTTPPGWTVEEGENSNSYFPSTAGGRDQVSVTVSPELKFQANPKQFVENAAAAVSKSSTIVSQESAQSQNLPSGGTLTLKSLLARSAQGGQLSYVVALVQGQDSAVLLMLVTPSEQAAQKYLKDFTGMLASLRFTPRTATQPNPGGKGGPLGLGAKQALPEVKPMNAAQFKASGGDPENSIIPDEFRCYRKTKGDGLAPELTLQILPSGQYRTPYGGGTLKVVKDGSLRKLQGVGGPLNGAGGYLNFDDFGQSLSLSDVGEDVLERSLDFECYQRGPRENAALFDFKLNTPKAGQYPCIVSDGKGTPGGTLELLPGNRYGLGGQTGRYTVDFRSYQDGSSSSLDFAGGPLDDQRASYAEDEYGLRTVDLSRAEIRLVSSTSTGVECRVVAKPTPPPSIYGSAKAPAPPKGSGGLSGNWVHWRSGNLIPGLQLGPDFTSTMVMNSECPGNICWEFAFFNKNGYVFTDEPDVSIDEADCTRTHPNGLPRCEVYRVQGGKIIIGQGEPEDFKLSGDTLKIAGREYTKLLPLTGLALAGAYQSKIVTNAVVSLGGTISDASLLFNKQQQFAYDRSSSTNLSGTGYVLGSSNKAATSGGTYQFQGNTLTFSYRDGRTVRLFAAAESENGKPLLTLLRLGGVSYYPDDGK